MFTTNKKSFDFVLDEWNWSKNSKNTDIAVARTESSKTASLL